MPVKVTPMVEADIDGAIDCIQKAFAADPYNNWVFDTQNVSIRYTILFNIVTCTRRCPQSCSAYSINPLLTLLAGKKVLPHPEPRITRYPLQMGP